MEATALATEPATAAFRLIPLDKLERSATNPRKHFDKDKQAELVTSVRKHGILQPILVRSTGPLYEIVAGERRFRAAKEAGLREIPATVRDLSDVEVLEIQVVENLQRQDLHPMEEAEGYEQLHNRHKYSVEDLAARVGKSTAYVYSRMKLCALTKEARRAFLDDRFTAGHAVLLARLKPAEQKKAMEPEAFALFDVERDLYGDNDHDRWKPRSVREFQAWIDRHVRFDATKVDPMLFPETVATLEQAAENEEKVVPITYSYVLDQDTRDAKVRTYTERCWKRADGEVAEDVYTGKKSKSKICEHSVTGIVVAGRDRGHAFKVCVNKEKCDVHWAAEVKAKRAREKSAASGSKAAGDKAAAKALAKHKQREDEYQARWKREEAERKRWEKAEPKILEAVARWAKAAPADHQSLVAKLVLEDCEDLGGRGVSELFPTVTSAQDVLRKAALLVIAGQKMDGFRWKESAKWLKGAIGVDAQKILDEVAPIEKPKPDKPPKTAAASKKPQAKKAAPAKKASKPKLGKKPKQPNITPSTGVKAGTKCRACGCDDEHACEGGCSWVEPDLCSACAEGDE